MKPVIQEEKTGCAIASAAAISGIRYEAAKKIANDLGIYADDPRLWSETEYIRELLAAIGVKTGKSEKEFLSWEKLPNRALLSIKWHEIDGKPFWHWVVFVREGKNAYVLDSKKGLRANIRTDFGRMKPKWFIEVFA